MLKVTGGALFKYGKLLLVKRNADRPFWPGFWEIPGGKVDGDETFEQAIGREFFEETGLKVRIIRQYHSFSYNYTDRGDATENDYLVESNSYDIKIDPQEHSEFRWVTREESRKLEMSPDMRQSIEKAYDLIKSSF